METDKLFNQIIDKFPSVPNLKIWDNFEDVKLTGWQNKHIYISSLNRLQIQCPMESTKVHSCYEELTSQNDIVEIFCFKNNYYVVDRHCYLLEVVREAFDDTDWEGDLFEEMPKKVLKSQLIIKNNVCKDAVLLGACQIKEEIAFLINTSTSVIVKIINHETFIETKCFTLRNTPITLCSEHNICLMLFVPKEEIEISYIKNWLPEVNVENIESGLLIISLPECIICGVLLDEVPPTPHFIFSWPFQAVKAHWYCLENKEPDRIKRKSNLVLVFNGGTVVILNQYGGNTVYMPLNNIYNAYISPNYVIITDYHECYYSNYSSNEEIICLPLKGVLGFCQIPGQENVILAITRHRSVYSIDLNVKIKRDEFKIPNIEIFDEFLRKNKYFKQLSNEIKARDNYINALSYALNNSVMKFTLSAQVVTVAGALHTFRIKIISENPGINFRNTIWKLVLTLSCNDCYFTFVRNLEFDLTIEQPCVDFITTELKGNCWDFDVNAKLVCYISKDKYRPSVNIGNVLTDISHFMQPMTSFKLYQSQVEKEVKIDEILECLSSITQIQAHEEIKSNQLFSFEVPITETDTTDFIVKRFLSNCRALWRSSEWSDICKQQKFQIFIAGKIINIEIKKSSIIISGNDIDICHSLKVASVKLLNEKYKINSDAKIIDKVDDLLQSLDLIQFSTEESNEQKRLTTLKLYKQFKEDIVIPLTGIKTNFINEIFEKKSQLKEN